VRVVNDASAWRLEYAGEAAAAYAANDKVDAVIAGGSSSRGHADRWSDIEIGVFWSQPPTDKDRADAAARVRGELFRLYPFDEHEMVWCDDYYLGHDSSGAPTTGVLLEVVHMTVADTTRIFNDVLGAGLA
jgi:hypothetical protein